MPAIGNRPSVSRRGVARVVASPRARRAMRQQGVDPALVRGSGPNGRIVEADVRRAGPAQSLGKGEVVASSCFTLRAMANLTTLSSLEKQVAAQVEKLCGTPLKLVDLVLRAAAMALASRPDANRVARGGGIAEAEGVQVGLDVETPSGRELVVLEQADQLGLIELVRQRAELVAGAQSSRSSSGKPAATALCVWDLSESPIDECVPTVAPPRSSVLAIGRLAARPMVVEEQLAVRQTVWLNLAADQRVMSPETAASLLGRIVELLERPFVLVCDRPPW